MNFLDEIILFIVPRVLRGMWSVSTGFVYLQFLVGLVFVISIFVMSIYWAFTAF